MSLEVRSADTLKPFINHELVPHLRRSSSFEVLDPRPHGRG